MNNTAQSIFAPDNTASNYSDVQGWFLSHDHHDLLKKVRSYCVNELSPVRKQVLKTGQIPPQTIQSLKDTGLFGLLIAKEYGGLGGDCLGRILSVQSVARTIPDVGALLQIAQLGTGSLIEFGSPEQKAEWLPALARGDRICTIAITEEHSGSHVLGMATTYDETDNGYRLNGEKCFIGNSPIADTHVVYARSSKHKNEFSAFIVEGERAGVDNSGNHNTLGLRVFPFGRVSFTDCRIPRKNLLGVIGQGKKMAYQVIARHGRPSLTALALGIHERILYLSIKFSQNRMLYSASIAKIPDVRHKLYEIYRSFEISRQASYQAAFLEFQGQLSFRAFALAKQIAGDNACHAALVAAEIFGARAGLPEYEIGQLLLDALMTRPPSGTGDVQRKRALESLLDGTVPPWEMQTGGGNDLA